MTQPTPPTLRQRAAAAPLLLLGLGMALFFTGFLVLLNLMVAGQWLTGGALIGAALAGAAWGTVMSIWLGRQRRRGGDETTARTVTAAVKSGVVPDGTDATAWLAILAYRRQQTAFYAWFIPAVFGIVGILAITLAVTDPVPGVFWGLSAIGFLALAVGYPIAARRRATRIASLRATVLDLQRHERR